MKKQALTVIMVICLLFVSVLHVSGAETLDMERTGTVSVTLTYNDKAVPGGSFEAYRVAGVSVENGADYSFTYTPSYEDCTVSLEDLSDSGIVEKLEEYTEDKDISGISVTVSEKGIAVFEDLETGLYLIVQNKAAEGYTPVNSFIVSVPQLEDGNYVYEIDATPKITVMPDTVDTTTKPDEPTDPPKEPTPPPSKLPQTGQNNIIVPVLAVIGAAFIIFGMLLILSGRKKKHE